MRDTYWTAAETIAELGLDRVRYATRAFSRATLIASQSPQLAFDEAMEHMSLDFSDGPLLSGRKVSYVSQLAVTGSAPEKRADMWIQSESRISSASAVLL